MATRLPATSVAPPHTGQLRSSHVSCQGIIAARIKIVLDELLIIFDH